MLANPLLRRFGRSRVFAGLVALLGAAAATVLAWLFGSLLPLGLYALALACMAAAARCWRLAPLRPFRAGELVVMLSLPLVVSCLPSVSLMRYLPPILVMPQHHGRTMVDWQKARPADYLKRINPDVFPEEDSEDRVYDGFVHGLGTRGTVVEVRGEQVELEVRGKRLKVSRRDCIVDDARGGSESRHSPRLGPGVTLERTPAPAREEIHLRGLTVEEAMDQVDKFLDDAYLGTLHRVRLVHGVGSGRLKRAVGEFLADHPHVERFTSAPADQGGVGVTIVTLKT